MAETTDRKIRAHYNRALHTINSAQGWVQARIEAAERSPEKPYLTDYLEDLDLCNLFLQILKRRFFGEREKTKINPGATSAPARLDGPLQP